MRRVQAAVVRVCSLASIAAVLLIGVAGPAAAATTSLSASGSGSEEVPATSASITVAAAVDIDTDSGLISYTVAAQGLSEPVTMAHIHKGGAGVNGPVVVPFDAAAVNAGRQATVNADPAVVKAIAADPAGYYVNVHTATNPGGAARGQLSASGGTAPSAVDAGSGGQFAALADDRTPTARIGIGIATALLMAGGAAVLIRRRSSGQS